MHSMIITKESLKDALKKERNIDLNHKFIVIDFFNNLFHFWGYTSGRKREKWKKINKCCDKKKGMKMKLIAWI